MLGYHSVGLREKRGRPFNINSPKDPPTFGCIHNYLTRSGGVKDNGVLPERALAGPLMKPKSQPDGVKTTRILVFRSDRLIRRGAWKVNPPY